MILYLISKCCYWQTSESTKMLHLARRWSLSPLPRAHCCLFAKLCPTLWDPWTVAHQAPLSMEILQARILEWVAMPSSGGISPTQGVNPGLPHCRWFLYHLSHQAHPKILEWEAYPFSRGSSWPRNRTQVSCIAGRFLTSWATGEAHIDNKQRSTVWHMKLYSVFSNNLYGKRIWKRRLYMYSWITLLLYTWN